jgi:hypothetical protein
MVLCCVGVLIGSLFLGPVIIIVGIVAACVIWYNVAQSKG